MKNRHYLFLSLLLVSSAVLSASSWAATVTKANNSPAPIEMIQGTGAYSVTRLTPAEVAAKVKEYSVHSNRRLASTGTDFESQLSDVFKKKLRPKILALKTGEDLAGLIAELDKNYDSYPPDAKMLANEFIQFKSLRGIIYRLVPISKQSKVVHSVLLTEVMKIAGQMKVYFPNTQWKAAFQYVTEPYDDVVQFPTVRDFQRYVSQDLYLAASQSAERLKAIPLSTPVVWDNQLLSNTSGAFADDMDRYTLIQEAERNAILATKSLGMATMSLFAAYSMEDFLKLASEIGALYGVDAMTNWNINGVPSQRVVEKTKNFTNLYVLYDNGGELTRKAKLDFIEMVYRTKLAWTGVKGLPDDRRLALNPGIFNAFSNNFEHMIPAWESMMSGETELKSRVTGEVIKVDLPAFYDLPPHDLKSLLPTKFDTSSEMLPKSIKVGSGSRRALYRNYFRGSATDWSLESYKVLFPKLTSGKDVAKYQRILMQSWGGALVGLPLSVLVQ